MRRRAGEVRTSEEECRIRRRHDEESRSIKGEWGGVQEQRGHEEESRSSKGGWKGVQEQEETWGGEQEK
jgi:hypothetical protein